MFILCVLVNNQQVAEKKINTDEQSLVFSWHKEPRLIFGQETEPCPSWSSASSNISTQYESALIGSPLLIEPSPIQIRGLIEFFMKWTEPSPKRVLTPPGWRLRDPVNAYPCLLPTLLHANCWSGWLSQK